MGLVANTTATLNTQTPNLELLIGTELVSPQSEVTDGKLIQAVKASWSSVFSQLNTDPELLYQFAQNPQAFEEFIAATYNLQGFKVTLTPRSGDRGRDVIAEKLGFGAIRILDQCKAFSRGRTVNFDDVRAMIGVLSMDNNASKAIVSTTADFAPGVLTAPEIQAMVPYRLELRNGKQLIEWLKETEDDKQT